MRGLGCPVGVSCFEEGAWVSARAPRTPETECAQPSWGDHSLGQRLFPVAVTGRAS